MIEISELRTQSTSRVGRKNARHIQRTKTLLLLALLFGLAPIVPVTARAMPHEGKMPRVNASSSGMPPLRSERLALPSGAELVTIFGSSNETDRDVPLVAVLNDTLGDDDTSNDRLRYVWVFSYCPPSVWRRVLASIPFNYSRFSSGTLERKRSGPPPAGFMPHPST